MNSLENKVVWVTGAGRGIGKAIAVAFGKEKTMLALSSRTANEIKSVSESINKNGGTACPFPCDVSSEADMKSTVKKIKKTLGDINILVNNAGVARFMPLVETSMDDWDRMININLKGAFLCTKAVLPTMIEQKEGHIVNIVSVAGIQPFPNASGYCASKYGMMGLSAVTREEAREHNVKVTAILPGAVDTPIWNNIEGDFDHSKMMLPEDIAQTVILACKQPKKTLIEDIIIRPITGNL
ncbi:MAG: SDR family NAD(P)-dependent oxidoreductase [Nitrospinota bacterium]|jgi:NADP-dependent 3-hydroxy acid dehydrogenase YdfG|nr:SDR family NAD(P)-dependent oxidoreductase [Nitrospinota bacterium]MDP7581032.1 SDR family NAD(P)-dependent oxidoreductase [Nitrospinota bacterium]HJN01916.1 SDR family NAD(P)-dependent oxidoreductase [Nitrospinota bacterium]